MKHTLFVFAILTAALASCGRESSNTGEDSHASHVAKPPVAAMRPYEVKSPHGARNDPYYWLRDDSRKDQQMLAYLKDETAYADAMLAPTRALQEQLYKELAGRVKQDDATVPYRDGPFWYYQRFEPGKEYPIHARRKDVPDAPEQIVLDVNALAPANSFFSIATVEPSPDHRLIAFAQDAVGRRQYTLRVLDTANAQMLADRIENAESEIAWASDNRSFIYVDKDPVTLLGKRVKRHVLGTQASADTLIYEEPDPSFYMSVERSRSGRFLYIVLEGTLTTEYRYAGAADPKLVFRPVVPRETGHEYRVRELGERFILLTNSQAPNFRVVSTPVRSAANRKQWHEIVPHRQDAFLHAFEVFDDFLVLNERSGGLRKVRVRSWNGARDFLVGADEAAYDTELGTNKQPDTATVRYIYSSLATPRSTYDLDMRTGDRKLMKREPVLGGFDSANYRVEYLHATARDGTRVPVTVLHRAQFERDGKAPCYQHGYGAYGSSNDPDFDARPLSLVDRGFVYALAHVRGGQEMGRAWYDGGRLLNKKNSFTDFIDVTHFLVEQKICARDQVFASGRSAGGLLMGAIANMAPQDYRGIVTAVPYVDAVTTMLDETIPLTTNEFDEWGNPKQKQYYDYMLSYSPYDNVTAQAYPAMLVTTGLWDSQVQYYEPAKWVAKLRAVNTGTAPILMHVDMQAGHSGKAGRFERYADTAREYAFILQQAGML